MRTTKRFQLETVLDFPTYDGERVRERLIRMSTWDAPVSLEAELVSSDVMVEGNDFVVTLVWEDKNV